MAYLRIHNLSRKLGDFQLGPLSLSLAKNDYLVLLGPTGCGKSSLLDALAGLRGLHPQTMFLDSREIGNLPPQKRRIGYVVQGNTLFPHLSVRENIAFGLRYSGLTPTEQRARLSEYLSLFFLEKQAAQRTDTLSGGEQRKTALARSLITHPDLLLLDEPLSMLDHNGRRDVLSLLQRVHNEMRLTTIHVTHDRLEAWSLAQQCAIMDQGRLRQLGTVQEVFRRPRDRFTAEFLGGGNIYAAEFEGRRARLAWGSLTLPAPAVRTKKGFVLIRPEYITLRVRPGGHGAQGVIAHSRDFGAYTEVLVRLSETERMLVHQSVPAAKTLKPQTRVYLSWPAELVHAFAGETRHA